MTYHNEATATHVLIWDDSEQDRFSGDEVHVWHAAQCDDDGEPVGTIHKSYSEADAQYTAEGLGRDHRLPVEWD